MEFTFEFLIRFTNGLFYGAPLFLTLVTLILLLGMLVGRTEGWRRQDAIYFAFITATTVGYGDFHPHRLMGKALAIFIALTGMLLTGIIIAIGVEAAARAFEVVHGVV